MTEVETETRPSPDPKHLRAVYVFGIFSMSMIDVFVFLIPIYAGQSLGMTDTEIGALVGARSFVSLFLSIHGGALMDRFGVRRVTLFFTGVVVVCAPLFPLLTAFWALLVLQAISGFAISMGWTGGQTLIARISEGDAEYIGRFSSVARIGTTLAPVIAGFLYDIGGPFLAYGFGFLWAVSGFVVLWFAPEPEIEPADDSNAERFRMVDILPRLSDYAMSFAMMAIPAVAFTAVAMLVRNSTYGIQTSVYMTYSQGIGFTATKIGILFAAIEIAAGVGSWFSGRAMRRFDAREVLTWSTIVMIVLITATPLFGSISPTLSGIFIILIVAQVARGLIQGVSQPILFSIQAKTVGRRQQGSVVGLRQTMNRLGGVAIPLLIGLASDTFGREQSFYIIGALLLVISVLLGIFARRRVEPIAG
jgi:MFS family permease